MASPHGSKVQVLSKLKNRDLTAPRNEYLFRTPFLVDALLPLLKDKRDEPMLCLQLNILLVVLPGMYLVFWVHLNDVPMPHVTRNLVGLVYVVATLVLFLERFVLFLHFSSHRTIFKYEILNHFIVWCMAPMFGVPAGVYKLHHVVMHHIENNAGLDITETVTFQRDSWSHFFNYWMRFVLLIWVDLPYYAIRTRNWNWFAALGLGLCTWIVAQVLAACVSVGAMWWCLGLPYIVTMSAMAFGNWSQHIFVNPEDPYSNYSLTYNCIDTFQNQTTFNDGYHVIHHANARLHWSEIPEYFYKKEVQDRHIKGGALTFRNIHFFDVGVLVMTGQLRKLVQNHYVHLGTEESAPTVDEVEAKLRKWLLPVQSSKPLSKKES